VKNIGHVTPSGLTFKTVISLVALGRLQCSAAQDWRLWLATFQFIVSHHTHTCT